MVNGWICGGARTTSRAAGALACSLLLLASCVPNQPVEDRSHWFDESRLERVSHLLRAEVDAGRTPSLSVVIAKDGIVRYAQAFGYADVSRRLRAQPRTGYAVGSITKMVVAAAILQLAEAHNLRLDDTVTKYVPEYKRASSVTLQELLQQRSGLPDYSGIWGGNLYHPTSWTELIGYLNRLDLESSPGKYYEYNNVNYVLLARVVKHVTGSEYDDYVRRTTKELNITSLLTLRNAKRLLRDRMYAVGYSRVRNGVWPAKAVSNVFLDGSGDLVATAADVARLDSAIFDGRFLTSDSVLKMTTAPPIARDKYGMGIFVEDSRPGKRYLWHNGEIPGYHAMNAYFPDEHLAIIVLSNSDPFTDEQTVAPEGLAREILGIIAPTHEYALPSS